MNILILSFSSWLLKVFSNSLYTRMRLKERRIHSQQKIIFVSATKIGENTTNILNDRNWTRTRNH